MSTLSALFKRTKVGFEIGNRAQHKMTDRYGTVVGTGTRIADGFKYPIITVEFDGGQGTVTDAAANEFINLTRSRHNG